MRVLIACEESQEVCKAFRALGHEAYSCDIQPPSGGHPEWHIQGDALKILSPGWLPDLAHDDQRWGIEFCTMDKAYHIVDQWDLLIAHPPCTYLSNAGARWLYQKKGIIDSERYAKGLLAKQFFMRFYDADCPRIAVENPLPSRVFGLPPASQWIQPYQYQYDNDSRCCHPYTKLTGLWLKGLQPLTPTSPDAVPTSPYVPSFTGRKRQDKYGAAKRGNDAKNRAKTFPGIARAMAEQWGG